MGYKIWVATAVSYNVTIYSRAGAAPNDSYDLYYSQNGSSWTFLSGPLSSTSCTQISTVTITSSTIYIKAQNDVDNSQIYIRGANSSICPANLNVTCEYSTAITGTEDVAITVYVDGVGDYEICPV
jgi:hypothetical protein